MAGEGKYRGLYASTVINDGQMKRVRISQELDVFAGKGARITPIDDNTYAGLLIRAHELEAIGFDVCIDLGADQYQTA